MKTIFWNKEFCNFNLQETFIPCPWLNFFFNLQDFIYLGNSKKNSFVVPLWDENIKVQNFKKDSATLCHELKDFSIESSCSFTDDSSFFDNAYVQFYVKSVFTTCTVVDKNTIWLGKVKQVSDRERRICGPRNNSSIAPSFTGELLWWSRTIILPTKPKSAIFDFPGKIWLLLMYFV